MTKQLAVAVMMLVGFGGLSEAGETAGEAQTAGDSRIRSTEAKIVALVAGATAQSATFRGMVETIEATDGIVYIERGRCPSGVLSCLVAVRKPGLMRFLWIRLDLNRIDRELMAAIGHELRHAIEVLNNREVTTTRGIVQLYQHEGMKDGSGAFETVAAIEAGRAVWAELWQR